MPVFTAESRNRLLAGAMLAALLSSTGCATIAHGRTQRVVVTSEPIGAQVFVGDHLAGVTPVRLTFNRRNKHLVLRFEKEGFASQEVPLKRWMNGWVAAEVALSLNPFIGQGDPSAPPWPVTAVAPLLTMVGTDLLTGAAYSFPPLVRVALTPIR